MAAPTTSEALLALVAMSRVADPAILKEYLSSRKNLPSSPDELARELVREGLLTPFQSGNLLRGRWRGFYVGKYRVLQPLDPGGAVRVYLCAHPTMHRPVTLKLLPPRRPRAASQVLRLQREARAAAALDHPNLVRALDLDRDGDIHFLVTEFIDGVDLQTLVRRHGRLSAARAVNYAAQAAEGLQHLHAAGWVHREVQPRNLLLDRRGAVKVLDLGLVHVGDEDHDRITERFDSHKVLGAADYLAPEQVRSSHHVDDRADIYSLGCVLYFLLAGEVPYPGGTLAAKMYRQMEEGPRPLVEACPEVESELADVVEWMMAKEPADRPRSCAAVLEVLRRWLAEPVGPPPTAEMPQPCPAVRRLLDGRPTPPLTRAHGTKVLPPAPPEPHPPAGRPTPRSATNPTAGASLETPAPPPPEPAPQAAVVRVATIPKRSRRVLSPQPPTRKVTVLAPEPRPSPAEETAAPDVADITEPEIPSTPPSRRGPPVEPAAPPRGDVAPAPRPASQPLPARPHSSTDSGRSGWLKIAVGGMGAVVVAALLWASVSGGWWNFGGFSRPSVPEFLAGKPSDPSGVSPEEATKRIGQETLVEMRVRTVARRVNSASVLLCYEWNDPTSFSVVLDEQPVRELKGKGAGNLEGIFMNRIVRARGRVASSQGRVQLVVRDAEALRVLPD